MKWKFCIHNYVKEKSLLQKRYEMGYPYILGSIEPITVCSKCGKIKDKHKVK